MATVNFKYGTPYIPTEKPLDEMLEEQVAWEVIKANIFSDLSSQMQSSSKQGFKRMDRYKAREEFEENFCWRQFMIDRLHITPTISFTYESPPKFVNIQELFLFKHRIYTENKQRLSIMMSKAIKEERFECTDIIKKMLEKQDYAIMKVERLLGKLKEVNFDKIYIQEMSDCLHEKYRQKEKEYNPPNY